MTEAEYDTISQRLDSACTIKHELVMFSRLRAELERVKGDYFHLTTLSPDAPAFQRPGGVPKVPVSAISCSLTAWITQEEQRLTEELAKL